MGLGGLNNSNQKGKKKKAEKGSVDANKLKEVNNSTAKIQTKSNNSAANRSRGAQRGS